MCEERLKQSLNKTSHRKETTGPGPGPLLAPDSLRKAHAQFPRPILALALALATRAEPTLDQDPRSPRIEESIPSEGASIRFLRKVGFQATVLEGVKVFMFFSG